MHHRTNRLLFLLVKNTLLMAGAMALVVGYAIAIMLTEGHWSQYAIAMLPVFGMLGYVIWTVTKIQMEREEREQEITWQAISRDPTDYSQFNQQSKSHVIYNVYKDEDDLL